MWVLCLVVGGCSGTPADVSPPPALETPVLRWAPCHVETAAGRVPADCGWLFVAERASDEASRVLRLPVTVVHSSSATPAEPIFWLAGGPGESNMQFKPPPGLLANHEVVMVGYRGVDGDPTLDCPEVRRAVRGTGPDLLAAPSLAQLRDAFERCVLRLRTAGIDPDAYSMLDVIDDLEAVREQLGYERVNLLSASYGTRVAQLYAQRHPGRIHRSAMVAVNPPGRFVWEPEMTDRQIEYYARLCAEDPGCRMRTADLARTVATVVEDMPRRWLFVPIDPGKVRVVAFALLFNRDTAVRVFDAFIAAEHGDPSGLALMSLAYDLVIPRMFTWGDMLAKGGTADCDPARDYATELDPPGSILGAPFSKLLWGSLDCALVTLLPAEYRAPSRSETETLLLVGSVDFSTPAEYAERELLPWLARGHLVRLAELGHTSDLFTGQRPATRHLLATFFARGEIDASRFRYAPMDFSVAWSFPLLARLLAAATALLALFIATLGVLLGRRLRRQGRNAT